jgi:hypothetical protein
LRSLELTTVIDVKSLPLRKYIKSSLPGLPVAVAGASRPTERQLYFRTYGSCVHVQNAGGDVAHGAEGVIDICRVNRGRKTILGIVVYLDGFFKGADGDQGRSMASSREPTGIRAVTGPKISS